MRILQTAGLLLFFFISLHSFAQDRCGIGELHKLHKRTQEADFQFENWLKKQKPVRMQRTGGTGRTQAVYQIPVVVHVIHNGEGHSTNIPDEQILSQIRVLNEDFRRENADASNTPNDFQAVAGSIDLEFVLAKRTPEGLETNGIVRVRGSKDSWRVSDQYELKALSYWPAEDYLNIWVCNLTDYLGYAQFPQSTILNGLENASTNRLTDGVVIAYDVFGSIDDGNFNLDSRYNKGRTTTHEVGHFFGLRHIAGDDNGSCGGNGDYVDDTPDQASQTFNCPSHPQSSCSQRTMFQNFLDYTNDVCMNIFTQGQMDRIQVVLENSPRRESLLTSKGSLEPEPVANDMGIRNVISPDFGGCPDAAITPSIELRNYGSNPVTSLTVRLYKDNNLIGEESRTETIAALQTVNITFNEIVLQPGTATFRFEIHSVNGGSDGNASNNIIEREVITPEVIQTPFSETFAVIPDNWILQNPDDFTTWEISNTPLPGVPENRSMTMNFYDYEDNEGELDILITPLIDLRNAEEALLTFSIAHARYQASEDGLRVVILTDCNPTVTEGNAVYEKYGADLATQAATNLAYVPTAASAWRTETVNLGQFVGEQIQVAFVGINDWGNNLYLDNVRISTNTFADLSIVKVNNPPPVICSNTVTPTITVENLGSDISSFEVRYTVNGGAFQTFFWSEGGLSTGDEVTVTIPAVSLTQDLNTITFELVNIDGLEDVDPFNNSTSLQVAMSSSTHAVPFRENFEGTFDGQWTSISPNGGATWQERVIQGNTVMFHRGFTNTEIGSQAWFVSPTLDFSAASEASLYFDYAYRKRGNVSDKLEVRASLGCDKPFDIVLGTYSGEALSIATSDTEWTPKESEWLDKKLNLAGVAGKADVRLAFVVTNNNGNNLYIDNLETFFSSQPPSVEVEGSFSIYPNPTITGESTQLVFDLPELAEVSIEITDAMGRSFVKQSYHNVLNQIYSFDNTRWSNGMYVVRLKINDKNYVSRFILAR